MASFGTGVSSSPPSFPMGLREVVPNWNMMDRSGGGGGGRNARSNGANENVLVVRMGATQSTLTPMPLPDGAGGFVYEGRRGQGTGRDTANRCIEWSASGDTLELTEISLDHKLDRNRVKFRFMDAPILSGGISIHETLHEVVVLVATVSSVHKMSFPHPERIRKQLGISSGAQSIPSIFAEANAGVAKEHCHVLQTTGTTPLPHLAASFYSAHLDESYFTLSNSLGSVYIVKMGNLKGMVTVNSLKTGSYLGRLLGNFGGMLARGAGGGGSDASSTSASGSGGAAAEAAVSLAIHPVGNDTYVFGLCKDHKVRMWSATSFDCVMVEDVLSFTTRNLKNNLHQGSQSHQLRKILVDEGGKGRGGRLGSCPSSNFCLSVFLCFSQHSQFCVLRPNMVDGQFRMDHVATVYAPEFDLIDFQVTGSHLWALWTNPDGHPVLRYATFNSSSSDNSTGWNNVALNDVAMLQDLSISSSHQNDPRQAYLHQLFYPGRFSPETLLKAVSIYRRSVQDFYSSSAGAATKPDSSFSMSRLRDDVCAAVEAEIQNEVIEYEISDEEYLEVSHSAWARMYSVAVQYHQSGLKPMGLIVDQTGRSGLLAIIKKSSLSFVRPLDALEHLVFCGDSDVVGPEIFADTPILCEDPALCQDVINLMKAVAFVDTLVPPQLVQEFAHGISRLSSPDLIARRIVHSILSGGDDDDINAGGAGGMNVTQELSTRLQQVCDISKALEVLLISLELDRGIVSHSAEDIVAMDENGIGTNLEFERVFSSPLGISVVAESLNQLVRTRFALTRNLIVLQLLMLECGFSESVSPDTAKAVDSTFLPRYVVMAHCYYVLVWITGTCATAPPDNSLEQGLRRMAVLKITSSASTADTLGLSRSVATRPVTLSELFLQGPGGRLAHSLLTSDTDVSSSWSSVLMPMMNISAQMLWPRCAVPTFQQFLLSACQHTQIQEYVRLLSTWCDWKCHSRQFILGSALLNMGEPEKASDWMIQAGGGVGAGDRFLLSQLFSQSEIETMNSDRLAVLYFLKVIELFEQSGYYDYVIELAKTAIDICDPDDPNRTTLCYILFSHHLKLGHNDEAYDSMIVNPDRSRRKDSLRQFVVTLFERRQLRQLASYPYIDLFDDLEHIIEERARSVDLNINNYYDFLYSFHVSKENYRKAAHVMFECGMRLGTEVFNVNGLKRQAKCYLACLNCLSLVNEKYAWIVKPDPRRHRDADVPTISDLPPGVSPKRSAEGDEILRPNRQKTKMEVLEKEQIEKEFELISARLKLVKKSSRSNNADSSAALFAITGPGLSAGETVSLLVSANLYEDAANISRIFDLDYRPILEGLSSRCVWLAAKAGGIDRDAAWDWLAENTAAVDARTGSSSSSSVEAAWKLLQDLLSRLEEPSRSKLHKAVSVRLFSQGAYLPSWLVNSYKKNNPAELLHLYLSHGYLEDSALLASEYISAVLGTGKEYFGLETALTANARPVWLPYNTIDRILLELKDHRHEDRAYAKLHKELNLKIDHYLDTAQRVSTDMMELRRTC